MMTNTEALARIESAFNTDPFCACGEPTTIVVQGDEARLVCASLTVPRGRVARMLHRLEVAHVSRLVLQDPIVGLAA